MTREGKYLFTSESVSMGHPDKVADQISDSILDAIFTEDPQGRVACETMVTTGLCVVAGEVVVPLASPFYGDWPTSRIAGPWKGAPGSEGW